MTEDTSKDDGWEPDEDLKEPAEENYEPDEKEAE